MTAAGRWADALAAWAIPEEILASAPESPWGFPPAMFAAAASEGLAEPLTVSHQRALEALPADGVVLDVGAGGGASSLPLAPHVGRIVAVDASADMLDAFRALAAGRAAVDTIVGRWPDVAPAVGAADVVICGHVAYNVAALDQSVIELTRHGSSCRARAHGHASSIGTLVPVGTLLAARPARVYHRPTRPGGDQRGPGPPGSGQRWRRPHPLFGPPPPDGGGGPGPPPPGSRPRETRRPPPLSPQLPQGPPRWGPHPPPGPQPPSTNTLGADERI